MKLARTAVLMLALGAAVAACGDDDPEGPDQFTVADLQGSWDVSTFTYTPDDGTPGPAALASLGLGITDLTVTDASGTFEATVVLPDGQGGTQTINLGQAPFAPNDIDIVGDSIFIDFAQAVNDSGLFEDQPGTISASASGNIITIVLPEVDFDFTLQGNPQEPASLQIVATRQ